MNEDFFKRFKIEPRCTWKGKDCYLVIYDKDSGEYVRVGGDPTCKEYAKFDNSDQVINFINKYFS